MLCMKILESERFICTQDIRFLMVGGTWTDCEAPIPLKATSWL